MDMMMTVSKKSLESELITCKWCEKSFRSERTLSNHMCPKKRRWADRDMTHARLGYRVYQMFYTMNTTSNKVKTQEDFIRSQYYEGFTKFGRSCIVNEYLQPEKFAEWLIKNAVKLTDWSKDKTYDDFLLQYVKKETGLRALERTILYFNEWAANTAQPWNRYFVEVNTSRAVHDIRSARVSPWVLYLSNTGDQLLTRLTDEQIKMVNHIIDANFWMQLFKANAEEVDAVEEMCKAANI